MLTFIKRLQGMHKYLGQDIQKAPRKLQPDHTKYAAQLPQFYVWILQ